MNKPILYHDLSSMRRDVRDFLDQKHKLLIGGDWVETGSAGVIATEDPGLETVLTEVPNAGRAEVDAAVDAARRALDGAWGAMTPTDKANCMFRLADLIEANLDQLAELEGLDTGKPRHIARALDIPFSVEVLRYNAGWATKLTGKTFDLALNSDRMHAYTRTEPVGVVAGIYAWNFPFAQAIFKLAPALAAGCTVILKPAEQTPLTSLRLAQLVEQAGFPAGTVNVLTGTGAEAGAAISEHPGIDKISFTGSTDIGRLIAQTSARTNFKRLTLEMGGKSPNIIFDDANVDRAIAIAASAIFNNSGQVCNAGSRLLVQESIYDRVVDAVARIGASMQLGCSMADDSRIGPLMSARQLERVSGMVEAARKDGVAVASGGQRVGDKGYFYAPTVLRDVRPDQRIAQEEIFGPVLCAMKFTDEDDLLAMANNSSFGLAASIWTNDLGKAHRVAHGVKSGAVWVNTFGVFDPNLPFGGYKQSGWGREMGLEGVEAFRETKSITMAIGTD